MQWITLNFIALQAVEMQLQEPQSLRDSAFDVGLVHRESDDAAE